LRTNNFHTYPLFIPAKFKNPILHEVRNKNKSFKTHTFYQNKYGKNIQKLKNTSTEKVPRIPHIYIQKTYELFAGLTNL